MQGMTSPGPEIIIKMSLLVQCSVVESFSFNGKHVRSVYVKDVGQCLVSKDVYEAVGYEKENEMKAIQRLVPENYKIRFGNAQVDLEEVVDSSVHTHPNAMLLKEPGLYCFLLRSKRDEAEPFMEWVVETVLPRKVRKLASVIKEKDNQIQSLEDTNEKHQHKILKLNEEIDDLIKNRHVPRRGYFDNVLCFIKKNSEEVHPYYVIRCQYRQLEKYKKYLKLCYPDMEEVGRCDDPNAIHRWNIFKSEVIEKPNYYNNHFSLMEEKRELLEAVLDVTI